MYDTVDAYQNGYGQGTRRIDSSTWRSDVFDSAGNKVYTYYRRATSRDSEQYQLNQFLNYSEGFGYARVSTKEQNLDRQIIALKEHGIEERDIIIDNESGKDLDRAGYISLKNTLLRSGDTLIIKSLD